MGTKMDALQRIILSYLASVNIVAFAAYGADKYFSKAGLRRIPERTLLALSAVGGSAGAFAAMRIFRHKTRHRRFYIGVPVMMAVQLAAVIFCCVIHF